MQIDRVSWNEHWMRHAVLASEMSTCMSGRKVGAVTVKDKRILSTGFNGVPAKIQHPEVCLRKLNNIPSGESLHLCGCQHAESNAIANAARHGVSLIGSEMFSTTYPCVLCFGIIVNAGVMAVYYMDEYNNTKHDCDSIDIRIERLTLTRKLEIHG